MRHILRGVMVGLLAAGATLLAGFVVWWSSRDIEYGGGFALLCQLVAPFVFDFVTIVVALWSWSRS